MSKPTDPRVEILRALVTKAGGPAAFARHYSRDDADRPIDATYVSQLLNGHREFRDKARINMARRAGLPDDFFEKAPAEAGQPSPPKVMQDAAVYDFKSNTTRQVVGIMNRLTEEEREKILNFAIFIEREAERRPDNSTQRAG
jgi:hypothetical protein